MSYLNWSSFRCAFVKPTETLNRTGPTSRDGKILQGSPAPSMLEREAAAGAGDIKLENYMKVSKAVLTSACGGSISDLREEEGRSGAV